MRIALGTSDYLRSIAETPRITLLNRYYEADPTNQKDQIALLTRPALRKWKTIGDGPIRAVYSQPGAFEEQLFVVSFDELSSVAQDETETTIGSLGSETGAVSMAATDFPHKLFIADGLALWLYQVGGFASGTLTVSGGNIVSTDVVKIDTIYYKWTNGSVDAGTPAGTLANPWLVALGANDTAALANLKLAINASGTPGTTYSTALAQHATVQASSSNATTIVVVAVAEGAGGNSISTTETGANTAWGGLTLSGGGAGSLTQVVVPDGDGIVSVGFIAQFVICVVAQGFDKNGRFYWIEPGDTVIDPLNFATAERSPDPVWSVLVVGDQFWLPGTSTNEVWYPTGDGAAPFLRQQGRLFDKGIWEGTAIQIKDTVMAVGTDGTVYKIDGEPVVVSTPGIAQRLREAINAQREG